MPAVAALAAQAALKVMRRDRFQNDARFCRDGVRVTYDVCYVTVCVPFRTYLFPFLLKGCWDLFCVLIKIVAGTGL